MSGKLCLAISALLLTSGCVPEDSLQNEDFDLWCGGALCSWDVNAGDVDRVNTWHEKEFGASLVGNPAAISQVVKDDGDACFQFTVVAEVSEGAKLFFEIDFLDDDWQTPEISELVEAASWEPYLIEIPRPEWADTFRIILRKTGKGEVVLARVADERSESCGATAKEVRLPDGFVCEEDGDCAGGRCNPFRTVEDKIAFYSCGSCSEHDDCEAGEVCGVTFTKNREAMHLTCGDPGRNTLGARCLFDEECATEICFGGQCSECVEDADCGDTGACREAETWLPHQCDPGEGKGEASAPCLSDADCASGRCESEREEILNACLSDGRPCTRDEQCPENLPDSNLWEFWQEYLGEDDVCNELGLIEGYCS